jgi:3-carboxy-cis,cis-muconate cycloisomerase
VSDTALVLTVKRAHAAIARDHRRLTASLRGLSDRHAHTVMLGRTLLQPAPPITFGLKAAGWLGLVARAWAALDVATTGALVLQFGGATGTLAALGSRGLEVSRALAGALGLSEPPAPWHAHRDRLAALVASHGVYVAALGKVARDLTLLMQGEVAEAAEPGGGSSTMPQKRNPAGCARVLASATRVPGLVASYLTGMVQEHERGVGGWHAEWPTVAAVVQATGGAAEALAAAVEGLAVAPEQMVRHIDATNGTVFAERAAIALAPSLGRDVAGRILREAVERSRTTGRSLREVLSDLPSVTRVLSADELGGLDQPARYLGVAEALRLRLMAEAATLAPE